MSLLGTVCPLQRGEKGLHRSGMRIPDQALDEFIEIYKEEFGEDISRREAGEVASRLLALYELLARKLPNERKSPPAPTQPVDGHSPIGFRI